MHRNTVTCTTYRYLLFIILAGAYIFISFHRLCAAVVAVDMIEDLTTGGAPMGPANFFPFLGAHWSSRSLDILLSGRATFHGAIHCRMIIIRFGPLLSA